VIDNLGTASGGADENSAQMIGVMAGLRQIAEEGELAVLVIHHKSKGDGVRADDSLRGHSSIESAVDLALVVEREEGLDAAFTDGVSAVA
jgi:RecA-family ATPase